MCIEEQVVKELIARNFHIAFAESCTGGMATAAIVNVADASKVLDVSFVTYANEAKMRYIGVNDNTIAQYGVVSEPVAYEMAKGVAMEAGCEVGVGITGIAGPGGGTSAKPVGMVCFAVCVQGKVCTYTQQFGSIGRNEVRKASVDFVLGKVLDILLNMDIDFSLSSASATPNIDEFPMTANGEDVAVFE